MARKGGKKRAITQARASTGRPVNQQKVKKKEKAKKAKKKKMRATSRQFKSPICPATRSVGEWRLIEMAIDHHSLNDVCMCVSVCVGRQVASGAHDTIRVSIASCLAPY